MSEMKPCPFCGSNEERPINHAEDCFIRMYSENVDEYYYSETLVHDRESMKAAWNTRAERTCEIVYEPDDPSIHYGKWTCSECGHWWMYPSYDMSGANYCPDCGARIERGESCHAVGWGLNDDAKWEIELSCGHFVYDEEPDFCPECGAKVVSA